MRAIQTSESCHRDFPIQIQQQPACKRGDASCFVMKVIILLLILAALGNSGIADAQASLDAWAAPSTPKAVAGQRKQQDVQASLDGWAAPSIPKAAAGQRKQPGEGPIFLDPPLNSSSYAHRRGQLAVQLPEGAVNLSLKLLHHEGFVFGTAYSPETVAAEDLEWYRDMTRSWFNGLTPENSFKWPLYESQPGQYERAKQVLHEQYIPFAQAANYSLVRGHTLEWGKVGPFWAHQLECDAYVAALKERVTRDVKLFKGKFNQYDVFNEIIESPGMLEKCKLWDTAFPAAFKWAHEADPDAQLCINDLSLIEAHNSPELMRIVKEHVWAHGAPIHCIGIQAHFEHYGVNLTYQQEKLDLLATLGLDLYITEFSLFSTWAGPNGEPYSDLDESSQATTTAELFRLWFSHPAVKGIIMWGWWDANIWATNAGIYRADKTPKQAALAIHNLWHKELSTAVHAASPTQDSSQGWVEFEGFYGTYTYEYIAADGRVVQGTVQLGRGNPRQSLLQANSGATS